MKILVTGGAGFIGNRLCRQLINSGHSVICLDNFVTGRMDNIRDMMGRLNFQLCQHDIETPINFIVDQIYHLACPASPPAYQADPIRTLRTNFIGTMNMLEIARNNNCRILFTSTSEVYGDPLEHPQTETYRGNVNMIGPRACYDEGKRVAETLMMEYSRTHNIAIRIARVFNTYGPSMCIDDGRVVTNFIKQILTDTNITIYGDGSQTRSFCYIDDTVRGLVLLMATPHVNTPINIGNPTEVSIKELAQMLVKMTKSKSKIVSMPLPEDDPVRRKPDIRLAMQMLKWEPRIAIDAGLRITLNHFITEFAIKEMGY